MSQEIEQISQLQKKLSGVSEQEFLQLVGEQFIKDFSRAGIKLSEVTASFQNKEQLFDFAHNTYQLVLREQSYLLNSLLYLIDIPEKHVGHNFSDQKETEVSAEIILIREAQKVFLRKTFST